MEWLKDFVLKNKIEMVQKNLALSLEGIKRMSLGQDVLHDERHVWRMLKDAILLGQEEKLKINWAVLLPAICWHDVWTVKKMPSGLWQFLKEYSWDGIGSAKIFNQEAKKIGLEETTKKAVAYAIRQHPAWHLGGHKTLEAKILWDVDNLETWSWERMGPIDEKLKENNKENRKEIKKLEWYFRWFMRRKNSSRLYFNWSKKEWEKRKERYVKETEKLLEKYGV